MFCKMFVSGTHSFSMKTKHFGASFGGYVLQIGFVYVLKDGKLFRTVIPVILSAFQVISLYLEVLSRLHRQ